MVYLTTTRKKEKKRRKKKSIRDRGRFNSGTEEKEEIDMPPFFIRRKRERRGPLLQMAALPRERREGGEQHPQLT